MRKFFIGVLLPFSCLVLLIVLGDIPEPWRTRIFFVVVALSAYCFVSGWKEFRELVDDSDESEMGDV